MTKSLLEFLKEARWQEILRKLLEERKITEEEYKVLKIVGIKGDKISADILMDYALMLDLSQQIIKEYFEAIIEDGKVYFRLKEDKKKELEEKINKALIESELTIRKVKIGSKEFEIPLGRYYYVILADKKIREEVKALNSVDFRPELYIYVLEPDSTFSPILISRKNLVKEGHAYLILKKCENPYAYFDEEEWILILRRIYRGKLPKQVIENEARRLPVSPIIKIYEPFGIEEEIFQSLTLEEIKDIINKAIDGIDETWAKISLGLAVRLPMKDELLGYGTHAFVLDRPLTAKTLMGELTGEVFPSVSIASLTGFATSGEVRESIINFVNYPIYFDELEEEKREVGQYLLNLLRHGKVEISRAGRRILTRSWASLVFTANAEGKDELEMAKHTIKIISKISPNFEGLASRISVFSYYQFKQFAKVSAEENLMYKPFLVKIAEKLGEIFYILIKHPKVQQFLTKKWNDSYLKELKELENGIVVDELKLFVRNIPYNYIKLNILALKMALWDFLELIKRPLWEIKEDNNTITKILEKADEYRKLLQQITVFSLEKFAKMDTVEEIVRLRLERLSKLGKKLLRFIDEAYEKGYKVFSWDDVKADHELKDKFTIIFGGGYRRLSQVLSNLTDEHKKILESFGLEISRGTVNIVEESKWQLYRNYIAWEDE